MKWTFYFLFCIISGITTCLFGQQRDYKISLIPENLKQNSNAVVRHSNEEFEYKSPQVGVYRVEYAITILNTNGEEMANFLYPGDKFRQLSDFSAIVFDANGKQIKKYKLSDVDKAEWSSNLADYGRYYFLNFKSPTLPFTVLYNYEVNFKNGILGFPVFVPLDNYDLSLENAGYSLIVPEGLKFLSKGVNFEEKPNIVQDKKNTIYKWKAENLKAIKHEPMMPSLGRYIERLYLRPIDFVYDNTPGTFSNWEDMGKWSYSLLEGRDELSKETLDKIKQLTANCTSDREKVKVLYDYLGETTRYISIQLGIGGYQPIPAKEVARTGFGDCKGLTNYLKAMLNSIEIPANYTCIEMNGNEKTLMADFPNFNQMNHVILQVPLPNDTLWLECTNPKGVPFGYVHSGIAGQEALVLSDAGGKIVRLPKYDHSLNLEKNSAKLVLKEDGSATANCKTYYAYIIYEENQNLLTDKYTEQLNQLRKGIKIPNATITKISIADNPSPNPSMVLDYEWNTTSFGNKTGSRLFVPINPFQQEILTLKSKEKRQREFQITNGVNEMDSIQITIPSDYVVESAPKDIVIDNSYGSFQSTIAIGKQTITIYQKLKINPNIWEAQKYSEFISFINRISEIYSSNIILKKQSS